MLPACAKEGKQTGGKASLGEFLVVLSISGNGSHYQGVLLWVEFQLAS